MSDTTESRWFKIIVFILSAIVVGVTIANVAYFNRIRTGSCQALSNSTATTMVWVNAILLVIAIIIFLWSLWRLLFSGAARAQVRHYMISPTSGVNMGFAPPAYMAASAGYAPVYQPTAVATSTDAAAMVVAPGEAATIDAAQQYL